MTVLDASALLAFLAGEEGADLVERHLGPRARCGAANWAEVAQKIRAAGADWPAARALLASYGLRVEPVVAEDAERAAELWRLGSGLSLADRLCLALGDRLEAGIMTADRAWRGHRGVELIR